VMSKRLLPLSLEIPSQSLRGREDRAMAGLGLYETLRILIPGWIAVAAVDVGARLALGESALEADGGTEGLVALIERPVVAFGLALMAGLLLYAIDMPAKTYPLHNPPSAHLREMLTNPDLEKRSTSLYFQLQDEFMPVEMRRNVYLFGSIYRVFVDLRVIAVLGFVLSVFAGLIAVDSGRADISGEATLWFLVTAMVWMSFYLLDFGQHVIRSSARHRTSAVEAFRKHTRQTMNVWKLAVLVFVLSGVAVGLPTVAGASGMLWIPLGVIAMALWLRGEIGVPGKHDGWNGVWGSVLGGLGAPAGQALTSHQRALVDVAMLSPWLAAASYVGAQHGRAAPWLLVWLSFLLVASIVLGTHKHENRIQDAFGDQRMWLDLHATEIQELDSAGTNPARWWP